MIHFLKITPTFVALTRRKTVGYHFAIRVYQSKSRGLSCQVIYQSTEPSKIREELWAKGRDPAGRCTLEHIRMRCDT